MYTSRQKLRSRLYASSAGEARYFALQWHPDGLAPNVDVHGPTGHGDAGVGAAQAWLATHFSSASPVEEMVTRSGLAERTEPPSEDIGWKVGYEDPAFFRRLFERVTGLTPSTDRKRPGARIRALGPRVMLSLA